MQVGERFNTVTHALGLLMSIAGAIVLIDKAMRDGTSIALSGAIVFAICAVILYCASTLFHGSRGAAKRQWECVDHCAIYLLIAGTYTAFALTATPGVFGWLVVAAIWYVALAGVRREWQAAEGAAPSLSSYLILGWGCVLGVVPVALQLSTGGLVWLIVGALFYTVGTVFYRNPRAWRFGHGTWHLFVLGGTVSHYMGVAAHLL
ncbi:MAG: hemolysin III family protein [Pseudomonadota bacterium]